MAPDDVKNELSILPIRKCSECGFLALIHNETRQIVEAEWSFREDGKIRIANLYRVPVCLHRIVKFETHMPENTPAHVVEAINKGYPCGKFTPWSQGLSPKEHQDMLDRQWMLDFQTKRDDADREWRDTQAANQAKEAAKNRRFQKSQAKAQRRHEWRTLLVSVGALVVAVCSAGAAIYSALTKQPATPPIVQPTFQPSFKVVIPPNLKEKPSIREITPKAENPPA